MERTHGIPPLTSPETWRDLPRWFVDPLGPQTIRPAYLPRLAPGLTCFAVASTPAWVERSTVATSAPNGLALSTWERWLSAPGLEGHLRRAAGCQPDWPVILGMFTWPRCPTPYPRGIDLEISGPV